MWGCYECIAAAGIYKCVGSPSCEVNISPIKNR